MKISYYLGKAKKISGPFTAAQIETMREDGSIERYSWILDSKSAQWTPLDPMPALPAQLASQAEALNSAQSSVPSTRATHKITQDITPQICEAIQGLEALCCGREKVISGQLTDAGNWGCELVSRTPGAAPAFNAKSQVLLNLLDPSSKRSIQVQARVASVARKGGKWTYRLHWRALPEMLIAP